MSRALLIDLDDTLMPERAAAEHAFAATAGWTAVHTSGLDVSLLAKDARTHARDLWRAGPAWAYCRRIGISSWEGLWCRFAGSSPEMERLRAWAPGYRRETWFRALSAQGVRDAELAAASADQFGEERRARLACFPDAAGAVRVGRERGAVVVVTNGASCLQREKLAASDLEACFDGVVVSEEVGAAKPDSRPFQRALELAGCSHGVMVGDSLPKDVNGAVAAGLDAIWLNREGVGGAPGVPTIASLVDLSAALDDVSRFTRA